MKEAISKKGNQADGKSSSSRRPGLASNKRAITAGPVMSNKTKKGGI